MTDDNREKRLNWMIDTLVRVATGFGDDKANIGTALAAAYVAYSRNLGIPDDTLRQVLEHVMARDPLS